MSSQREVLVVDDEPAIRLVCRVNLEAEGFRVQEAGSVSEARAVLERGGVDVLVLDVRLGVTSGLVFLREVRREGHTQPAILLTGAADSVEVDEDEARVVAKPFTLDELTGAVRELAARPAAGPVDSGA
jgi:DNA-binding response OmpR family regulator